ncbi:hypothetical protein [Aurantiacibacter flavus]|uniref:Uncharacterized protein n=1 Tax=Aurantiacibacter flavus TaxID=3145232 RepID=A0ABV0CW26_9SPHN
MKNTVFAAVAVLTLAACSEAEAPADAPEAAASDSSDMLTGEEPGFEAVAPGTYTVERANGDVDTITIHPGMTFSRIAADGTPTGGTIFMQDGKTCFVVEGVEGHSCFTDGPVQEDGSMQTTSDEGNVSTVRPAPAEEAITAGDE